MLNKYHKDQSMISEVFVYVKRTMQDKLMKKSYIQYLSVEVSESHKNGSALEYEMKYFPTCYTKKYSF